MRDPKEKKVSVLMVCLGNICRSPMAEAVLKHQINQRQSLKGKISIRVDSAGTGAYHAGDDADERTVEVCRTHKVPISCTARRVTSYDFDDFDYILAMDDSNLQNLLAKQPSTSKAQITLFGAFDPAYRKSRPRSSSINGTENHKGRPMKPPSISDPYYGGDEGFEKCYQQCMKYSNGFLDVLEKGEEIPEEKRRVTTEVKDAMGL